MMRAIFPALWFFVAAGMSAALAQPAPVYGDLPGVYPEEPLNAADPVTCEQTLVRRDDVIAPTRGPLYDTVYRCRRDGGPVINSGRLPPSLERQRRGLQY